MLFEPLNGLDEVEEEEEDPVVVVVAGVSRDLPNFHDLLFAEVVAEGLQLFLVLSEALVDEVVELGGLLLDGLEGKADPLPQFLCFLSDHLQHHNLA